MTEKDYRDLASLLASVEGKWLLTINDHPLARELFSGYTMKAASIMLSSYKPRPSEGRPRFTNLIIKNF
jgi:DNA adenine methylase